MPSQNDSDPTDKSRPYRTTIGDQSLAKKGVTWKWYAGGWDDALESTSVNPHAISPPLVDPRFHWERQPFVCYDHFAPFPNGNPNPISQAHLQDELQFTTDMANHTIPQVCFIKPMSLSNDRPSYTTLLEDQQHVAALVCAVQADKALWQHSLIIIACDDNGGRWDHVAPLRRDEWGPGVRVPCLLVSPFARRGCVDHQSYDTLSILKTIEERFGLQSLTERDVRAVSFFQSLRSKAEMTGRISSGSRNCQSAFMFVPGEALVH